METSLSPARPTSTHAVSIPIVTSQQHLPLFFFFLSSGFSRRIGVPVRPFPFDDDLGTYPWTYGQPVIAYLRSNLLQTVTPK